MSQIKNGADEFLDSVSDSIVDIPMVTVEDQLAQFTAEEIAAIDRYIEKTPYRMFCRTPAQRDATRLQLLAPSISNEIVTYVDKLLAEQSIRIDDEKREHEAWLIKQDIISQNKFKELRYRKALDQGIADDVIRLEFGREKVVMDIAPELTDMRRKNIESTKRVLALEAEIKKLKGE